MSSNLVPPQVYVDTPRPHQGDSNNTDDYNGDYKISVTLKSFVSSSPKSPKSHSRKNASPRISPRASPRLMKKQK